MSNEERFGFKDAFNYVQLIVGLIIVFAIGVLIDTWNQNYDNILSSENPGSIAYLLLPVYVGILVFGIVIAFQGLGPIAFDIISYLRQPQTE